MSWRNGAILAALIGQSGLAFAHTVGDISGNWRTVRHGADVRIEDCGDGTPCGFLVSVGADVHEGETHDVRNRDRKLRARPLENLPILWGYEAKETGWRRGTLYNPETGQTFSSSLVVISPDRIKVKGCLGPFCREQVWTRIPTIKDTKNGGSDERT